MYKKISLVIIFFSVAFYLVQNQKPSSILVPFKVQSKSNEKETIFEPLTLEKVFSDNHIFSDDIDREKIITLIVTGDVLLARTVNFKASSNNNYYWPFEKTAEFLQKGDITFINLETPLIKHCPLTNNGMIFCGDPQNIEGLMYAGVDVANIANNHAGNHGLDGVESTVEVLGRAGIIATGYSGPNYIDVKDLTFAFLGYNDVEYQLGISGAESKKIEDEISDAKNNADIVVVQFHWGNEYTTRITERQRELAYVAVDSGVDLIIGNHPHWIQPLEIYNNVPIVYAHGNFIFDQEWSLKTKQGIVGKYTFYMNKLIDVEFFPIQIEDYGQPYFLTGEKKNEILKSMKEESERLSSFPN